MREPLPVLFMFDISLNSIGAILLLVGIFAATLKAIFWLAK